MNTVDTRNMQGFAAFAPDGSVLGVYPDMKLAQLHIAAVEPDLEGQGKYVIHPLNRCSMNVERVKVEKFDGVTGELVEIVNFED